MRILAVLLCLSLLPLAASCKRGDAGPPVLVTLGKFTLTDDEGKPFDETRLDGKVWIAGFMFTRCPTICPRMMKYMQTLQSEAKRQGIGVHLLSFSVDPDNDTPEVLREYAARFGADRSTWRFLTGSYDTIRETSVAGLKLALQGKADASKADFGILHSSYLVLLDKQRNVRGYYETSNEATLGRLLADAQKLE